jgi:hypothetical protein
MRLGNPGVVAAVMAAAVALAPSAQADVDTDFADELHDRPRRPSPRRALPDPDDRGSDDAAGHHCLRIGAKHQMPERFGCVQDGEQHLIHLRAHINGGRCRRHAAAE